MISLMMLVYQIGFSVILLLASPLLLFSSKARWGVSQKLGFIPASLREKIKPGSLWVHAVSVGEFNAVLPLLKKIHENIPELPLLVTTTTGTGQAMAQEKASSFSNIAYFPYDLPFSVSSWLDVVKPTAFISVETEIWPGFIYQCHKRGVPVMSVNARMSPSSYKWYYRLRFFFKPVLAFFSLIGVQSESEQKRFASILEMDKTEKIKVLGNIKLDGLAANATINGAELKKYLGEGSEDFFFTAGSTHEGEEVLVLEAFKQLLAEAKDTKPKLVIAPRHPERFEHVRNLIHQAGFEPRSFSRAEKMQKDDAVFLLDTLGKLNESYSLSRLAFVGGTLVNVGGHNVAEPFAFCVPVVCGPYIQKTRDLAYALSEIDALTVTKTTQEFQEQIKFLFNNKEIAQRKGNTGKKWIEQNLGACDRALAAIKILVKK